MPKTFSVRGGLIGLVAVALCALVLIGSVGLNAVRSLQTLLSEVNQVVVPSIRSLGVIVEGQTAIRSANRYMAAMLDQEVELKDIQALYERKQAIWARIDTAWKVYEPLPRSAEEEVAWKAFMAEWAAWRGVEKNLSDFIARAAEGKQALRGEGVRRDYLQMLNNTSKAFVEAERTLNQLIEINAGIARETQRQSAEKGAAAEVRVLTFSALAMLILVVLGSLIVRRILGTLGAEPAVAKQMVEQIAKGDLRARVSLREDDRDSLMAYQHQMQQGLRTLVGEMVDGVSRAESAAHQLASAAEQVAIASETSSESASSMAASVEEMAVSIQLVADHTEDALRTARDAGRMSTEGGNIIESAIGEINAIATAVQSTASDIHSLSESSARISSIVQVIREVAEQTNLLALNAAIEAARAGESGRGFAVVADEVRKLAERTSGATAEIAQMIDRIQADTHSSVTTTEKAIAQVDRGVALASQAGQAIQQIRQSVDQVVNVVADIELAIAEQRSASQQIAQRVEQVAQVSEENGVAARQTADTAREMSALASQLQATAGSFTL